MINSHKDLIVWQKSVELCLHAYKITENFPQREQYGLSSQIRRAGVSIPSNIAEGRMRSTRKEFCQFLRIALGSTAELETQIHIAFKLSLIKELDYNNVMNQIAEITKMLNAMIKKLAA